MPSPHSINFPDDPDGLARYRREYEQQEEELARQRAREERQQQRAQAQQVARAEDFWAQVDARIEEQCNIVTEVAGEASGLVRQDFQEALARRDEKIRNLRRELATLRTELGVRLKLAAELAAARSEIEEMRQRAPSFKSDLDDLRAEVAKQQKTIVRLRGQNSILEYQQKQLDAKLSQMKRESASPTAVVQFETSSSRITVGNLHPDAADALRRFSAEVVDAYDGDPFFFPGPWGRHDQRQILLGAHGHP
jgi:chromosome segregation ATPase